MVKMKLTAASSLDLGCSSCSAHVLVLYCRFCMSSRMAMAASLVYLMSRATSMLLSQMNWAFSRTFVSGGALGSARAMPNFWRSKSKSSWSTSSSDMVDGDGDGDGDGAGAVAVAVARV